MTELLIFENKFQWYIGDDVVVKFDPSKHGESYSYIGLRQGKVVNR